MSSLSCLGNSAYIIADTLVAVKGKIVDKETQEPIVGKLFYEKLPYYDDMGTGSSKPADGSYQLNMVKNMTYNLKVNANGYETIEQEITVVDENGSLIMSKDFELTAGADSDKINLDNLIFTRGRAVISKSSHQELDEFANWLHEHDHVFRLDGHTDFQGNAEANLTLSQERVDAVRKYLIKKGVKGSRIKTKAFGGTQPLSRERTDEAKKANRRVEVTIL
jgi:OOP family OmpA-OmpF porin